MERRRASRAEPTWLPHGLTASLELPGAVTAGETLTYVLVLHNDTDTTAPLTPCPSYDESVQIVAGKPGAVHQLNCTIATVPAHSVVRFEMRLPVAREQEPVPHARLSWQTTPPGLQTSGVFSIT